MVGRLERISFGCIVGSTARLDVGALVGSSATTDGDEGFSDEGLGSPEGCSLCTAVGSSITPIGLKDGVADMGDGDELGVEESLKNGGLVATAFGERSIGRIVGAACPAIDGAEEGTAVGVPVYRVMMTLPSPPCTCPNFLPREPMPTPCM